MASIALVLSLLVPQVGNWWYSLTLLAPGAWIYYFRRGTRQEEVHGSTCGVRLPALAPLLCWPWQHIARPRVQAPPPAWLQVKVKMVTADDEKTTDIVIEGDPEEIDRFRKVWLAAGCLHAARLRTAVCDGPLCTPAAQELSLREKGMVYVKGILGE